MGVGGLHSGMVAPARKPNLFDIWQNDFEDAKRAVRGLLGGQNFPLQKQVLDLSGSETLLYLRSQIKQRIPGPFNQRLTLRATTGGQGMGALPTFFENERNRFYVVFSRFTAMQLEMGYTGVDTTRTSHFYLADGAYTLTLPTRSFSPLRSPISSP